MPAKLAQRGPALLALAIPVLAGLCYLAAFNAPRSFLAVNGGSLLLASLWVLFGQAPRTVTGRRIVAAMLLAVLFIPLLTGPEASGIARWLPIGPFLINSGTFAFPALAVLAAQDEDYAPSILLASLFAASLQPDAALGFAVVFAAVGLHDATKNWRIGVICIIGFLASIAMALRGELPPQPFVERVFAELIQQFPLAALGLFAAWAVSFALMLFAVPIGRASRFALAGSMFGFGLMALLSHYPTILIGYGAAPILGYGLALSLSRSNDVLPQTDN